MHIELMWADADPSLDVTTEIWRSDSPFDTDLQGATKIATLPKGVTRYLDEDTIFKQTYYYRLVRKAVGKRPSTSKLYAFDNIPYNGPGPRTISFGDEHFGYYGVIAADLNAVATINQIRASMGLTPFSDTLSNQLHCHKFVVGGKIKAFHAMPLCIGSEITEAHPVIAKLLNKESVTFNSGLHKWAMYLPTPLEDPAVINDVSSFPGELSSMLDVTTDMYAPVIHNVYGNGTGHQITREKGGIDFVAVLAALFPDQTPKHIITNHWKKPDDEGVNKTVTIHWTGENEQYPIRSKSIEPIEQLSTAVDWNECVIWVALEYMNLTQPR
jgi:hypothetical protein